MNADTAKSAPNDRPIAHEPLTPLQDIEDLEAVIRAHPAVADVKVVAAGDVTAYLVADADHARLLHRAADLEASGRLAGLSWHEPAADLLVAQLNRTETDFLYREIFADRMYLHGGIALGEEAVVVDVGANVGMFTVFAARQSPGAHIVAVEPVEELARAVAVNGALHQIDLAVHNHALGREEGEIDFTFYPHNSVMSGSYADGDEDVLREYLLTGETVRDGEQLSDLVAGRMTPEHRRCRVLTLTEVVTIEGLERIDLLKIDVEKAELDVLDGVDAATWATVGQIAIEVHDLNGRLAEVCRRLEHQGFVVTVERDPRLARTPCFNVYGYRSGVRPEPGLPRGSQPWPTGRSVADDLRLALADRRPDLPVPDRFVLVPSLQHVDAALDGLAPSAAGDRGGEATAVLADIWADLFGAGTVHDSANFFDLGGNSLTAVRLIAQVEARLGEDVLAPDAVFTTASFGDLAAILEAEVSGREPA